MRKFDYYIHRRMGAGDYLGQVGKPYKVSAIHYLIRRLLGFRATRVTRGASLRRVMVRATLARGAHRHSFAVREAAKAD